MNLLCLCGSLRARSSHRAVLAALARVASGITIHETDLIAKLPLFNPDDDSDGVSPAPAVVEFRRAIADADGLIMSSPEYAHGMPGALKNALDWLVSVENFAGTPVLLLNISPRSIHAHEQLTEVLRTMSARVEKDGVYTIDVPRGHRDASQVLADTGIMRGLDQALRAFVDVVRRRGDPDRRKPSLRLSGFSAERVERRSGFVSEDGRYDDQQHRLWLDARRKTREGPQVRPLVNMLCVGLT
jgi:chromate reductase, NAD(P)H dehydrogenase (quinone)